MTLLETLNHFDDFNHKNFDESEVATSLSSISDDNDPSVDKMRREELIAFSFVENNAHRNLKGPFYGPMHYNQTEGFPSLKQITVEMVEYWAKRAGECKNPILRARYYGLIWYFKKPITNDKPSLDICRLFTQSLIEVARGNYHEHISHTFIKLKEALKWAINIQDISLIEDCKNLILQSENTQTNSNRDYFGNAYDLLVENSKITLTEREEGQIIEGLEERLRRYTTKDNNSSDSITIDLSAAEAASQRLTDYYKTKDKKSDIQRVIKQLGKGYQAKIELAPSIIASNLLDRLYKLYSQYEMQSEKEEVLLQKRQIERDVVSDMSPIILEVSVPADEMNEYVNSIVIGDIQQVLRDIAIRFVPKLSVAETEVQNQAAIAPLLSMMSHQIYNAGRLVAVVDSFNDDLSGNVATQISDTILQDTLYLVPILHNLIETDRINSEVILSFLSNKNFIESDSYKLLKRGLEAYFVKDYVTFIHVCIPQIEQALRKILELAGGVVLKPKDGSGYHMRTFEDVLRDNTMKTAIGQDLAHFFRVLYTDQRGLNLRNEVCHGLLSYGRFNLITSNLILHSLLCLEGITI